MLMVFIGSSSLTKAHAPYKDIVVVVVAMWPWLDFLLTPMFQGRNQEIVPKTKNEHFSLKNLYLKKIK